MVKGHVFVKIEETDEYIKWQCNKCGKVIAFSKIYEPKTSGELPENAENYVDVCEVEIV